MENKNFIYRYNFIVLAMFLAFINNRSFAVNNNLAKKEIKYILCKNKGNVRTIQVKRDNLTNSPCVTIYTKDGIDQVMGTSLSSEICKNILLNIQNNLQKAQWVCKDVSKFKITSSHSMK